MKTGVSRNQYLYDNEDNYEIELEDDYDYDPEYEDYRYAWDDYFTPLGDYRPITDAGYPIYFTEEVIDDYYDIRYEDLCWCHLEELPDSFISENGDIWSTRMHRFRNIGIMRSKNKVYKIVGTWRSGNFLIHRLLAKYFIANPYNYPIVRHLNDNSLDTRLENLAWGTQYDNVHDSIRNGTYRAFTREEIERSAEKRRRPVKAIDLKTGRVLKFKSITDASRKLHIHPSQIGMILNGTCRRAKHYRFEVIE